MTTELLINKLFSDAHQIHSADFFEQLYPERSLQETAIVSRFAPSPTGFLHIGGIYTALINMLMARQSKGVFFLRIEDTDIVRSQKDTITLIVNMLLQFGIIHNEGLSMCDNMLKENGLYGPYIQTNRKDIYKSYIIQLVRDGLAYPCFLTTEELDNIRTEQRLLKMKTGCYGPWAKWRNARQDEILEALENKESFVIRLKSTGNGIKKIEWHDLVKGHIAMAENDNDIILLKSDGFPTYHLAHVIDDHLMKTTHVIRGDEWLSSTPVHLQLFNMLGWAPPNYAHIAPIEKEEEIDGHMIRRKLSKRKDNEANILFFIENGFPEKSVIAYLLHLMDSSFEEFYKNNLDYKIDGFSFSFSKFSNHGALFDLDKLKNISREIISHMSIEEIYNNALLWSNKWDPEFAFLMMEYPQLTKMALNLEREVQKNSKRFTTWKDIKPKIFFIYDELFNEYKISSFPENINKLDRCSIIQDFLNAFNKDITKETWLSILKSIAVKYNYAESISMFNKNKLNYKGHIGDIMMLFRVAICGTTGAPNLWDVISIFEQDRLFNRLNSIASAEL